MPATVFRAVKDRAVGNLAADLVAGATSLTLQSGQGASFPDPAVDGQFIVTVENEHLLCTARTGDALTVTRAQEGTADVTHAGGVAVELRVVASIFTALHDAVSAIEAGTKILDKVSVDDANFTLDIVSSDPHATFDEDDYLRFVRASNIFEFATSATPRMQLENSDLRVLGSLRVGSLAAPTNVTPGDLTAVRLIVGDDTALGVAAGTLARFAQTLTNTSGSVSFEVHAPTVAPVSNSTADFRLLSFQAVIAPPAGVTLNVVQGGYFEIRDRSDAAIAGLVGLSVRPFIVDSGSPAVVGLVSAVAGLDIYHHVRPSGTSTSSVTASVGLRFPTARIGSGYSAGTLRDIHIVGMNFSAVTDWVGVDIEAPTVAPSGLNFGIRNAAKLLQTGFSEISAAVDINAQVNLSAELVLDAAGVISTISRLRQGAGDQIIDIDFDGLIAGEDARIRVFRSTVPQGADDRFTVYVPNTATVSFEVFAGTGRIIMPGTGAGAGLLIGGDVQLFRGAANRLDLASGDGLFLSGVGGEVGLGAEPNVFGDAMLTIAPNVATRRGILIFGAAAQTLDYVRIVNSAGQELFSFAPDGADAHLSVSRGDITTGQLGARIGIFTAYGDAMLGTSGGILQLHVAEDFRGAGFDYWGVQPFENDLNIFSQDGVVVNKMTYEGQLQLPVAGSGAGVLIGGDVQLYRSAASVLTVPDQLTVQQQTLGAEVFRVESIATSDDPSERLFQNRVATTDATVTTLHTVAVPASTTVMIEAVVAARRTGGVAGSADDAVAYVRRATYKTVAGTVTLVGSVQDTYTAEDQAAWDCTLVISGSNVLVQVTGAVDNNVTWHCTTRVWQLGT